VRWLISAEIIDSEQVWILADELPAMGYQEEIKHVAERGRKRAISLVMGIQSISQLQEIYGDRAATSLLSAPSTKIVLRVDEPVMAEWVSDLLGKREIERTEMTMLAGLSSFREGVNLQGLRSAEHIVMASEIQLLPEYHGYLCMAGHDRTTITIPKRHMISRHPDFIPRNNAAAAKAVKKSAPPLRGWSCA
jgi:type IV secretory pathway TraG/TraD family ATPase VirD4